MPKEWWQPPNNQLLAGHSPSHSGLLLEQQHCQYLGTYSEARSLVRHLACPRGILNNIPVQHLHTFCWEEGRIWGMKSPAADWVWRLKEPALLWKASVLSSLKGGVNSQFKEVLLWCIWMWTSWTGKEFRAMLYLAGCPMSPGFLDRRLSDWGKMGPQGSLILHSLEG